MGIIVTRANSRDVLGSPEGLEIVDGECLAKLRDRYLAGSNGVLAVFGDVEGKCVINAMERALSDLPSGELAFADKGEG